MNNSNNVNEMVNQMVELDKAVAAKRLLAKQIIEMISPYKLGDIVTTESGMDIVVDNYGIDSFYKHDLVDYTFGDEPVLSGCTLLKNGKTSDKYRFVKGALEFDKETNTYVKTNKGFTY